MHYNACVHHYEVWCHPVQQCNSLCHLLENSETLTLTRLGSRKHSLLALVFSAGFIDIKTIQNNNSLIPVQ